MDQVRANLRDLKRLGVLILDVTGGEPLLYRNLVEMLTLAKKMRLLTSITTNGMLYPKYAEQLVGKVDALLFSIDSTDPDEHDRIRATKSFHLVARGARRRAQATPGPLHLARRDERVVRQRRRDDPLREGSGRDPLSEPLLLVLRQRRPRPREGQGAGQVLRRCRASSSTARSSRSSRPVATTARIRCAAPFLRRSSSRPRTSSGCPATTSSTRASRSRTTSTTSTSTPTSSLSAREREGRHEFCEGCTVYCYMRNSLMWKYPGESVLMFGHYLRERVRQRIRNAFAPPQVMVPAPTPTPDALAEASPSPPPGEGHVVAAPDRRRLPVVGP